MSKKLFFLFVVIVLLASLASYAAASERANVASAANGSSASMTPTAQPIQSDWTWPYLTLGVCQWYALYGFYCI